MWLLSALRSKRLIAARSGWSRKQLLDHQERRFRELLEFVFTRSPFYREYYASHGIRRTDLPEIGVRDLPMTDKTLLMENFDRISTDPVLRRGLLEPWLTTGRETLYEGRYVVVHTSGSSGSLGIFVFDKAAWTRIRGVIMARAAIAMADNPLRRTRIALCAATHGRFGAVTGMKTLPKFFRVQLCSVLDPLSRTVETLNRFQPDTIVGYATTLNDLACAARDGRLRIRPRAISSAGEILTDEAASAIEKAFGTRPIDMYASSESACLALQMPGRRGLSLMEDEHILELLDDDEESIAPGEVGQVVMTSLYNRVIPLVRYRMGDYVTRGERDPEDMFDNILRVEGRVNDALPVALDDGSVDRIHPIVLSEFFVPGAQKFQFVSEFPSQVKIRYVADIDCDKEVRAGFQRILEMKGAAKSTTATPERVQHLPLDPKTGKYRLVLLDEKRAIVSSSGE